MAGQIPTLEVRMTRRTPLAVGFVCLLCSFAAAQERVDPTPAAPKGRGVIAPNSKVAGEGAPSADEIKNLMEAGSYREALQKLSRALAMKGDAAKLYDRHELLRMKAEAHLNIKDTSSAASAFAAAAKEASDDAARAEDKASELVVKRSKNLAFTPRPAKKGEKADPIDITTPEKRKAAYAALLEEEKTAAAPALKAAKGSKTLPPIVDALKRVGDLRMLELAATGSDSDASKLVEDLAGQAHKLMDEGVQDMAELVKDIDAAANEVQPVRTPVQNVGGRAVAYSNYKKRGLMTRDSQDLKRVIADLKKLVPTARELAAALGEQGKQFEKVADDGEAVGNQAHKVLTTDYNLSMDTGLRRPIQRK
jgi:hypothetical protein